MNRFFIIYGTKDNEIFYVQNLNPILWSSNLKLSYCFNDYHKAEYSILRDYDTYHSMKKMLSDSLIDSLFIAELVDDNEIGRVKIL